jgi:polar amino acid transport system substrate-binding protein
MRRLLTATVLALAPALAATPADAETVRLTTLEWCPYTCSTLPGDGVTTSVLRDALKAAGHELEITFLPWQRAVDTAKKGEAHGYFPEYPGAEGFEMSAVIGSSPLGLVTPADKPVTDASPAALAKLRFGTVQGYVNAEATTKAIEAGMKPEAVIDDATNLRKTASSRLDAAEIDRWVMAHLLRTDKALAGQGEKLAFGPVLEEKTLHVAFAPTPEGRRVKELVDAALAKADVMAAQNKLLSQAR